MRPLVTIGISTYNRADGYLQGALLSALKQGYPNLEIVVSDNGSTDHTESFVKSFEDPRVRYFKQEENIGAVANFDFCLEQAQGAYFLLLHDDDLIDPDFVEACMSAVGDDTSLGIIRTGTRVIDDDGKTVAHNPNRMRGLTTADFFVNWFTKKTAIYFCSTLFNTQLLKDMGGLQTRTNVFEDVVAIARLSARHGRGDVYENKASFRIHGSNKGSTFNSINDWAEDSHYLLDVLCEEMPGDAERLLEVGKPYLCERLYRYASKLPDMGERVRTYLWAYRSFDYSASPLRYLARQKVLQAKAVARKLLKERRTVQPA